MSEILDITKTVFNKIISGENVNIDDIQKIIFDKNFKLQDDFLTSEDFSNIIASFNFNGDEKTDLEDFKYLINHIQDLDIIFKLVKLIGLIVIKFCKLKQISLTGPDVIDTVIRLLLYCVLFIVAQNCEAFRTWAKEKNNTDVLFTVLSDIVSYIQTADEIKNIVSYCINFFKDKIKSCLSTNEKTNKILESNVQVKSIKAQLNKEYNLHQINKKLMKLKHDEKIEL